MKNYILQFAITLLGFGTMVSCTDNDYAELNKGNNELALTAGSSNVVLNETDHSNDALELSWTTGTNYGTGNKIYYTLELAKAGTQFAHSYVALKNVTQEYSWKKTVEELNTILHDNLGIQGADNVSLEARVTATIDGNEEKQVATTSFQVTTYVPVTSTLYLIGDATPNGWSADDATVLTKKDSGIFTWTGKLKAGSFKFITTLGSFLPSYGKGTDGNLTLRATEDQPDGQFTIENEHYYIVNVNLLTGVLTLTETESIKPDFDQLYFVGNPTGWAFVQMAQDPLDSFLFRYGRYFDTGKGGEFKFGTGDGAWDNMYKATVGDASYTSTAMQFVKGYDPDNKWNLKDEECGKAYKICVDIRSGKERMLMSPFTPYAMIYMVGDAAPGGWTIGDATPLVVTTDPYVFTWEGKLNTGELKFTCDKKSDWNGAWFMPVENSKVPTGKTEQMLFIDKSSDAFAAQYLDILVGSVDFKWKIQASGNYKITLNQLEETVKIEKV